MKAFTTTKQTISQDWQAFTTVSKNVCEFIDAACLAGVAGYAIYEALNRRQGFWYDLLLFAGLVIALQAFVLLVRHFNYKR